MQFKVYLRIDDLFDQDAPIILPGTSIHIAGTDLIADVHERSAAPGHTGVRVKLRRQVLK